VACLRADLDDPLACVRHPTLERRKAVRPINAIERRFREVRRRTRPMGTFQDRASMERIRFAVFSTKTATKASPPPSP
jgi:transposase-like protein